MLQKYCEGTVHNFLTSCILRRNCSIEGGGSGVLFLFMKSFGRARDISNNVSCIFTYIVSIATFSGCRLIEDKQNYDSVC